MSLVIDGKRDGIHSASSSKGLNCGGKECSLPRTGRDRIERIFRTICAICERAPNITTAYDTFTFWYYSTNAGAHSALTLQPNEIGMDKGRTLYYIGISREEGNVPLRIKFP